MSRFFETRTGNLVNLDHVASTISEKNRDGKWVYKLRGVNGETLGFTCEGDDLEQITAPIIPAAPGTTATTITIHYTYDHRPTEAAVHVGREPIVAWRVVSTHAIPVFTSDDCFNARRLIEMPGGGLLDPKTEAICGDLDDAKAYVLMEIQDVWDHDHPETQKTPELTIETPCQLPFSTANQSIS